MSSFDYERQSDRAWDDRGAAPWSEFDWQLYLKHNEQEVARFLALFRKHKQRPDHLDHIAHLMGWGAQHWSPADAPTPAAGPPPAAQKKSAAPEPSRTAPAPAPAPGESELENEMPASGTAHEHPVFIATRALYQHIYLTWEHFLSVAHDMQASPAMAWKFAASLHAGELNAVMALEALEISDFALASCHFKNALSAVNHSFSMLQMLPLTNTAYHVQFFREGQTALFDLREIWLRALHDCREESRRLGLGELGE